MQSVKFKVSVRNHRITDDLPPEVPDGDAEVEIRFTTESAAGLGEAGLQHLDALFVRIDARSPRRSSESIDRQIAEERASWND